MVVQEDNPNIGDVVEKTESAPVAPEPVKIFTVESKWFREVSLPSIRVGRVD